MPKRLLIGGGYPFNQKPDYLDPNIVKAYYELVSNEFKDLAKYSDGAMQYFESLIRLGIDYPDAYTLTKANFRTGPAYPYPTVRVFGEE